jgi:hypothetical protein
MLQLQAPPSHVPFPLHVLGVAPAWHIPFTHTSPSVQASPSSQAVPEGNSTWWHTPLTQESPVQELLSLQWLVDRHSTHMCVEVSQYGVAPPQSLSAVHGAPPTHMPPMQVCPTAQALPHDPQFWLSLDVSTHMPPQYVVGEAHWQFGPLKPELQPQAPKVHVPLPLQVLGWPLTHMPDWHTSDSVQLSPSSQAVPAGASTPRHMPDWQASSTVHGLPSLHAVPSANGLCWQALLTHWSCVQAFPSSHWPFVRQAHAPFTQD